MAIGKVGRNGTLNENGAFYSVQDVNTLLENSGGGDLPEPTVADAGKAVIVDEEGKYALGEGGSGGGNTVVIPLSSDGNTIQITASELRQYITAGKNIVLELYAYSTQGSVTFEMDTRYYFAYYMTNATEGEEPTISEYLFGFMYYDKNDSQFLNREFVATSLSDNPQVGQ